MSNKNINVLILDDEESILSSLRRLLEDKGYNVVTNSNPAAAIEYMRNIRKPLLNKPLTLNY